MAPVDCMMSIETHRLNFKLNSLKNHKHWLKQSWVFRFQLLVLQAMP
jgi:hypothetical protein